MDRKVIVLTPSEWENRVEIGVFAEQSYQHNHYNKDAQLAIKSFVYLAVSDIKEGNIDNALAHLDKIPEICGRIYRDSCKAQEGIAGLMTLIEYKLKEEAKEQV